MKETDKIKELEKRIEALEARIAKLESNASAAPENSDKKEVITDVKRTSSNIYYKTSAGRVLGYYKGYEVGHYEYLVNLKKVLAEINEVDAIDLSDLTSESLREAQKDNTERWEKFLIQVSLLAKKYGAKGSLPALLPNDWLLGSRAFITPTEVSKKAIKF